MKKIIFKTSDILTSIVKVAASCTLFLCLLCIFLQVFTRYVLNNSLSWTEELGRYAAVWTYSLGFSLATKHGTNACIDIISKKLKGKAKVIHTMITNTLSIICCLLLVIYGFKQMPYGAKQFSAVLHIPLSFLYVSVMISAAICIVHMLANILMQLDETRAAVVVEREEAAK